MKPFAEQQRAETVGVAWLGLSTKSVTMNSNYQINPMSDASDRKTSGFLIKLSA